MSSVLGTVIYEDFGHILDGLSETVEWFLALGNNLKAPKAKFSIHQWNSSQDVQAVAIQWFKPYDIIYVPSGGTYSVGIISN